MAGQMKEAGSMMGSTVGRIEKKPRQRVVRLFREQLGYHYLGDWTAQEGNRTELNQAPLGQERCNIEMATKEDEKARKGLFRAQAA